MSLLQQINETAQQTVEEQAVIMENIAAISDTLESDDQPLTEAVTEWLAKLRGELGRGQSDPEMTKKYAYVLGAISALTDPVKIDALNITDAGTLLYNVSNKDNPQDSKAALQRLLKLGMNPSIKGSVDNAMNALQDPREINNLIGQLQTKIDQVMRTALAKEKGGATSATGGAGVGGSPERAA